MAGDPIDREDHMLGQECLDLLFEAKLKTGNVFILQSNHLMYHHIPFFPNEWWMHLHKKQYYKYTEIFDLLPYVVLTDHVIALHGLPVKNLHNSDNIEIGSSDWYTITWGRLSDPIATKSYIKSVLDNNNAKICIRSHDHYTETFTHGNRILTFTTSRNIPNTKRLVAVVDLTKKINSIIDIQLRDIDEGESIK